ncbi:MAG: PfkB family carbohydrate kinase [Promethearchaeia archaeon]
MDDDIIKSDLIILGHIAKDIIEIDGEAKPAIGGSVYYGGIAGSHMGLKIFVITRLKKEDYGILDDFEKYGVKYRAFPSKGTSGIENIYNSSNLEVRKCKAIDFAGEFQKKEIPDNLETKFFIVGPIMAGEIDKELLTYLGNKYKDKLCLDIQGFIRVREADEIIFCDLTEQQKQEILSVVTILKVDNAELEALTGKSDLKEGAQKLSSYGPKEILITHQKGISVYINDDILFYPWINKPKGRGRTGRGDTSFISYVGSRIGKEPKEALKFAVALTSLKLESPGPFTLPLYQVYEKMKELEEE